MAREHIHREAHGVLGNSAVLMVSKILSWALAFLMVVFLPRYLGDANFGKLYFAISFTTMLTILVDFGVNSLVTREVARRRELAGAYLLNGALLKMLLWVLALAIIGIVMNVARYPSDTKLAVWILSAAIVTHSLSQLAVAVLQALDRMAWIAVSQVAEKAVVAAVGLLALALGHDFVVVAGVMLVASVLTLALNSYWLYRGLPPEARRIHPEVVTVPLLFRKALPFFSVLFFGAIYFRIDVVIMSLLATDRAVGWYGAAYRLFEALNFFPEVLMFALFPVLCRMSARSDDALKAAAKKSLNLLLIVGIPISVGVFVLSDKIIAFLYGTGDFANSVDVLRVLALAVVFLYVNAIFVRLLIATERQGKLAIAAATGAVVNVGLNLLLVPPLQHLGAAIATLATETVVLALNFSFLPKGLLSGFSLKSGLRMAGAALVMAACLVILRGQAVVLLIAVGAAIYLVSLLGLKAVPSEDLALARNALLRLQTGTVK